MPDRIFKTSQFNDEEKRKILDFLMGYRIKINMCYSWHEWRIKQMRKLRARDFIRAITHQNFFGYYRYLDGLNFDNLLPYRFGLDCKGEIVFITNGKNDNEAVTHMLRKIVEPKCQYLA